MIIKKKKYCQILKNLQYKKIFFLILTASEIVYICREVSFENIIYIEILYNLFFRETSRQKSSQELKKNTTDTELQQERTSVII